MANLSVTAANVKPYDDATINEGVAGEAIVQGKTVYKSSAGQIMLATNAAQATGNCVGIALTISSRKQPVLYQMAGTIDLGATLAIGATYVTTNTAGGIHTHDDVDVSGEFTTGDYPCILGTATEANKLPLAIKFTPEAMA